jgi:purine nucleosidase
VLRSGADITLVGMDVTMTTLLSAEMIEEVAQEGDEAAKTLMRTEFYVRAYKSMYPGITGCGLHDPLAVAVAEEAWPERSACSSMWSAMENSPAVKRSPIGD